MLDSRPYFYDSFLPSTAIPEKIEEPVLAFAFKKDKMLVKKNGQKYCIPEFNFSEKFEIEHVRWQFLGRTNKTCCFSIQLPEEFEPTDDFSLVGLRYTFERLSDIEFALAGLAYQIVEWDRTHQFCGHCGAQTDSLPDERAKKCSACDLVNYPRLAPAVIVMIERDEKILLLRSPHFPENMYSVLAGFVEPGETLEEAVVREVEEEVGIRVKNIRYFGSQPWPFPHSLMIGFTAEYESQELQIRDEEIEDADWFAADELPKIPGSISISRALIDHYLLKQTNRQEIM